MVATVCSGADQYHHTTNTLKYADRAKEIKTHIQVPETCFRNAHTKLLIEIPGFTPIMAKG